MTPTSPASKPKEKKRRTIVTKQILRKQRQYFLVFLFWRPFFLIKDLSGLTRENTFTDYYHWWHHRQPTTILLFRLVNCFYKNVSNTNTFELERMYWDGVVMTTSAKFWLCKLMWHRLLLILVTAPTNLQNCLSFFFFLIVFPFTVN